MTPLDKTECAELTVAKINETIALSETDQEGAVRYFSNHKSCAFCVQYRVSQDKKKSDRCKLCPLYKYSGGKPCYETLTYLRVIACFRNKEKLKQALLSTITWIKEAMIWLS